MIPLQTWGEELPVEYSNELTITFVAVFFLLMIGIGVFAGRLQSDSEDYFAAGRRAGLFVIALSVFAGIQSGWGIVGNTGVIYLGGFEYFILVGFVPVLMVLSFWLIARKMRTLGHRKDAITAPDAMYYRFEDERLRKLGAVTVFLGSIGMLAPQYAALGIIGAVVLPVGFFEALVISLVVVGFYTVVGGMLAALWSDAIQGAMMALGGFLTFYYVFTRSPGGFDGMIETFSTELPAYFNLTLLGMDEFVFGIGFFISFFIVFATIAGQPHFIVKFYMSRNVSVLKWSAVIAAGGYLMTILYWWAAPFMRAAALRGDQAELQNPDAALPLALVELAPPIVAAFVITAILAAIMSTSNAFMNIGSAAVVHDWLEKSRGMELSKAQQVRYGRVTTLIILLAAFVLAATFPNIIFVIGAAGWGIFAAVLFPCVAIAYNWKGATAEGALWGGSIGLALTLILAYGGEFAGFELPYGFLGGQVATVVAVLVFVGVSLVTSTNDYRTADEDIRFILDTGRLNDGDRTLATDGGADESE